MPQLENNGDGACSLEKRFRQGDRTAFDQVVETYGTMVQRLVYRLSGWDSDCEDIVQDVFLAALAHQSKFRGQSGLRTWLFRIAVNKCRSHQFRKKLWRRFSKDSSDSGGSHTINDPAHDFVQQEKTIHIRRAVRALPAKYRDAVVLKYLEELPTDEILAILNIHESTLYTRLSRARAMLQETLSDINEVFR